VTGMLNPKSFSLINPRKSLINSRKSLKKKTNSTNNQTSITKMTSTNNKTRLNHHNMTLNHHKSTLLGVNKNVVYGAPKKKKRKTTEGFATLSIKQPAAALILYRGKNIENRSQSKFKGGGEEFNAHSRWVLIHTGQTRQKPEPILSTVQLNAASTFKNKNFVDTMDAMKGLDQTTGSIVGAMLVSEQRPSTEPCVSVWASENEVHIMIEKTIAFTQPQKCKGALCLFPIQWETLNKIIQEELYDIKDQFIMRHIKQ